uniref:Autophagy-related protein 2 n=1 Tax=Kalmanozyma brasiliensis (strain GHG001) TaxID=1365824 RepID=V5EVI6_KALBG
MASYFLPSFLTGWNLASVSPFSLSANLQKRILSYLLKRTLGHLVDGGQLDLAQIDAGIGSGRIEIHNVRLDAEAINRRLSSLPIAFVEGQIGRILIQLPVPNFWSGELSITVSDVSVSVKPRSRSAEHSSNANQDLSASFASAASQLFVEDDEAQEIEQSIHESLDPEELRQDQRESAEDKGSLIATYVEALLTRLKVAIERVQVHFLSDAVDLSLKLHSATVQSSNLRTEQAGQDTDADRSNDAASATIESPQRCRYSETRRTLELQGFQVWMQDYRKQATSRDTDSSSSSDDSADETLSASRSDLQDMSQSIASLQESSASLYESAIGGSAFQEAPASAQRSPSHRSAKAGASHPVTNAPHMLFSLGTEPVVITYKTTKERHEVGSSDESSSRTIQRLVRVMTDVDVQVGNAGAVVFIDHISLLMIAALKETIEAEYDMSGSMATLAASVATIQASTDSLLDDPSTKSFTGNKSPYKLDVKISFVRIDVRTPQVSYDAAALAGRQLGATRMGGLARSYREQNVDLTLSSVTLSPSFDPELVPRIKRFLKAPAGVFENVEPNEVTRISFKARDCSVLVAPPTTTSRAAVAIGELSIKTKLTSHAPKTSIKLAIGDLDLYAAEGELSGSASSRATAAKSAAEHWTRRNYARLLHIPESKGSVHLNTLTRPEIDVKITKLRAKLQATADTLDVVSAVVGAMTASQGPASKVPAAPPTRQDGSLASSADTELSSHDAAGARQTAAKLSSMAAQDPDRMADLLSGIEDDAYHLAAPLAVGADLVDDDVPSDAAFLGAKGEGRYHPEIVETTLDSDEFFGGESVASLSLLSPRTDTVLFADEDVTIRLLDPKGICPVQEYFTDPDLRPQVDSALGTTASSLRVRVSNFDLSVRLHAGYDWASTRKAVQQEAKLVRKRLQKIKQLLAEGQVPDDSVEAATSHLLDSIHMSLPTIPAEMDADAMMQAVEDELGDPSDAVSTADSDATASWQALPNARRGQQTASRSSKGPPATNASHNKLQRSQRSMIDFNFRGLDVEYDKADPSQSGHVVSRLAVNARRVEIIDNIKTSTWRTFLTEMQDQNAALRHDAEGKMAKVEIVHVRPQGGTLDGDHAAEAPEVRMRAKIAPLRLHVDQDALDFLKKYFMFKVPGQKEPAPSASSTGPPLPFVQFAEVLPIKIKLDYKPKRVDYNLLRQGKTIELMNFFHFEGSEMVLRHITLRGINGWARLFDTLNDIWTPDVKANQLADFLSGLGPIRSLVNVGAGLADLVLLPIEQYHKDGRVLRGVQRGATSFAKSTALEAVKLGARLATGTQVILEQAEHILGGEMPTALTARAVGPDSSGESYESLSESIMVESMTSEAGVQADNLVSRYASQPDNMRDALSQAYSGLTEGLTSAAQTILAIPMEVYEPDPSGAAGATSGGTSGGGSGRPVVKAVPIAILKGARGATQAIAKTMQGVQVTLGDMENVKEGKYKQPSRGR